MLGSTWYDVIDRTDGSREIVFSSKILDEAIEHAEQLHQNKHQVYINEISIDLRGMLTLEVIDNWDGYVPYEVKYDEEVVPKKKTKKKKLSGKKTFKF